MLGHEPDLQIWLTGTIYRTNAHSDFETFVQIVCYLHTPDCYINETFVVTKMTKE